jgi:hypothetical protein
VIENYSNCFFPWRKQNFVGEAPFRRQQMFFSLQSTVYQIITARMTVEIPAPVLADHRTSLDERALAVRDTLTQPRKAKQPRFFSVDRDKTLRTALWQGKDLPLYG